MGRVFRNYEFFVLGVSVFDRFFVGDLEGGVGAG